MRYEDIVKGVIAGTIEIDDCGHVCNDLKAELIRRYEHTLEYANGAGDGTWDKDGRDPDKDWDADMRAHYQRMLDFESSDEWGIGFHDENYCFGCGERLSLVLSEDKTKLQPRRYWGGNDHVILPEDHRCEFADRDCETGVITVKKTLVFTNFFRCDDAPEAEQYHDEWSLNCLRGRHNITRFKNEKQNIAYGQHHVGSIGVYVHPEKQSIILASPYLGEYKAEQMDLTDEEWDALDWDELNTIEGHKLVGHSICCDVWRWEAGCKDQLGPLYDELVETSRDRVEVDVEPGEYKFTHYWMGREDVDVVARFEKV